MLERKRKSTIPLPLKVQGILSLEVIRSWISIWREGISRFDSSRMDRSRGNCCRMTWILNLWKPLMPKLSDSSKMKLLTCHPKLQAIGFELIEVMDFVVIEGHRGKEAQEAAYAKGATQKHWPFGNHNAIP